MPVLAEALLSGRSPEKGEQHWTGTEAQEKHNQIDPLWDGHSCGGMALFFMKPIPIRWVTDIPQSVIAMAKRRTAPLLDHYGRNVRSMDLETLTASCYLQGIEDLFQHYEKPKPAAIPQSALPCDAPGNSGV